MEYEIKRIEKDVYSNSTILYIECKEGTIIELIPLRFAGFEIPKKEFIEIKVKTAWEELRLLRTKENASDWSSLIGIKGIIK